MNIILIGMRGSGKSTTGKLLAEKLNKQLIEIDDLIEKEVGVKIADYVKKTGWTKFREIESKIVADLASTQSNCVIATGGGVVENQENTRILKKNGFIIYLKADIETLVKRIGEDENRPLLTHANTMKEDLKNISLKRRDLYENAAQLSIGTDNKTVSLVVEEIINTLKAKQI